MLNFQLKLIEMISVEVTIEVNLFIDYFRRFESVKVS
jgi:hypothetical protein